MCCESVAVHDEVGLVSAVERAMRPEPLLTTFAQVCFVTHRGTLWSMHVQPSSSGRSSMSDKKQSNQNPTPEEGRRATDYALSMSSNMTRAEQGESGGKKTE